MHIVFLFVALVSGIGGVVHPIITFIEAFQDELGNGLGCLLCGLYMIYDFENENKWGIVLGSPSGWSLSTVCAVMTR
jgi:hypothetical protein